MQETIMAASPNGTWRQRRKIATGDPLNRKYFVERATNPDSKVGLPLYLAHCHQITNPCLKRAVWSIIWFALFAMCAYQIVERITLFMDDPSSTKNDYQINKTVIFPSILFCPNIDLTKPESIRRLFRQQVSSNELNQMLRAGNITVFDVWNATGRKIKKVESRLHQMENPINRKLFDVIKMYTPQGLCHNVVTLKSLEFQVSELTVELLLYRDVLDLPEVGIMSHSEKDLTLTKYLLLTGISRAKTTADLSSVIRPTEVMRRNSRTHPCGDNVYAAKCLFNCLLNKVNTALYSPRCRLPFMDEFYKLPLCNALDDITNTMQTLLNSTVNFSRKHCLCPPACHEIMYEMSEYNYLHSVNSNWRCLIKVEQNHILTSREVHNYRWFTLCFDIAGALGLWLGVCLLQILENGTDYFSRILTVWTRKRKFHNVENETNRVSLCSIRNRDRPEKELHTVDIVGVRKILTKSTSRSMRIFWFAVTVCSLCFSMYLCVVRIFHYLANPTATTLYYSSMENIEFPVITFCPEPPKGVLPAVDIYQIWEKLGIEISLDDVLLLLESGKINISDLWDTSRISLSNYATAITKHKENAIYFNWSFIYTVVGRCISVTSDDEDVIRAMKEKLLFVLFHKRLVYAPSLKYFRIILHSKEDYPVLAYFPKYGGDKFLTKNYDEFRMKFIEIKRPSPCESKQNYSYCIVNCIEEAVFKTVFRACRLPYMQEDLTIPQCYTVKEFIEMMNATSTILKTINFGQCGCPRPCQQYLYSVTTCEDDDYLKFKAENEIIASFVISARQHQVLEEYAADNIISLISDLGGALSLFLGLCGLQVTKIILNLITRNNSNCQNWTRPKSKAYHQRRHTTAEELKKGITSPRSEHKKNSPCWIRMLYFLVCFIVSGLCLSQCTERIMYFWTDPSDVITHYTYNESILFPVITIYPLSFSGDDAVDDEMRVNPLLKIYGIFVNDVPIDDIPILKVRNMYGFGLSVEPRNAFPCVAEKCIMNVDVLGARDYEMFGVIAMHSAEDFYYNPYDTKGQIPLRSGKVSLNIVNLTYRNTSQSPCADGATTTKCAIDCFEKHLFSNITGKCRGPYTQGFVHIPECKKNEEQYNTTEDIFWILTNGFDVENPAYGCSCPRKCTSIVYSYIAVEKTNFYRYETITRFSVNFPDKLVFDIREEPAYTFFKLLSDLGGTVGLYFGFGIFQMLQILENLFGYFKQLKFKQRSEKDVGHRSGLLLKHVQIDDVPICNMYGFGQSVQPKWFKLGDVCVVTIWLCSILPYIS